MMNFDTKQFRVSGERKIDLGEFPTEVARIYKSRKQYHKLLKNHVAELSAQQQRLYASNSYAVLLIFQAMDAAGKDGAIKQ